MYIIEVDNLIKEFVQYKQKAGAGGAFLSLLKRNKEIKRAVDGISFSVNPGELIGYIGPNGAGKSTTIKMLSGILVPSSGQVLVNGLVPYKARKANAYAIGAVFGQRSQLWWDLPIGETYNLLRHMYGVRQPDYEERIKFLKELLNLDEFWSLPVRQLSLGQRMRCELGAALIHSPKILYLDEPTIGMDALVKEKVRQFLKDINRYDGTTIILTTHDLEEIERICSRVMVINYGKLIFDGTMSALRERCNADTILVVDFHDMPPLDAFKDLNVVAYGEKQVSVAFKLQQSTVGELIDNIIRKFNIKDISLNEPPIDAVIKDLYEIRRDSLEKVRV